MKVNFSAVAVLFFVGSVHGFVAAAPVTKTTLENAPPIWSSGDSQIRLGREEVEFLDLEDQVLYDALIIGGGPSGLQAGMSLGRIDRTAVIFDSGNYRNKPTKEMHDLIALDGVVPADFRAKARDQLKRYQSVLYEPVKIEAVDSIYINDTTYFGAKDANGTVWWGKYLILGVGVQEQLPMTPGFAELWGREAFWCLWCDGWEHRDRRVVFLGTSNIVNDALVGQRLFTNVSIFTDGVTDFTFPSAIQEQGIDIDTRRIASYSRLRPWRDDSPIVITFTDGSSIEKDGIVTTNNKVAGADFGERLGVCHYEDNKVTIITDEKRRTSVPGVYAVGDVGSTVKNVPAALAGAKSAAVDLIVRLAHEEAYGNAPEWEEVSCSQQRTFTGRETTEEL